MKNLDDFFGIKVEEPIEKEVIYETFEELNSRLAKTIGRRHFCSYPCDDACDLPNWSKARQEHCSTCSECQRLRDVLERKIGLK